ncbi:MAG: hypothetical protein M3680_12350, partial [Myxococcota bacterium]|nr:hypothetical protein [Myxococcota bacterium]
MRKPRRMIERRLFDAVLLVLAGTSCQPRAATVREPEPGPGPTGEFIPDPDALGATGPADAAADLSAEASASDAGSGPDPDPTAMCATYQQGSRVKRPPAPASPSWSPTGLEVTDFASWDAARSLALCTIVRDRISGSMSVMRTPICCPQGGQKCAPPYKATEQVTRLLVERAEVRPDGGVAASTVRWVDVATNPERPHNCGRRPEGLYFGEASPAPAADDVGSQLAAMAELEAASVPAFERLARELAW